tara:strand:+ start:2547 stop:2786 length:240 start_codon:yes stop_codon:yes gene_type:complete
MSENIFDEINKMKKTLNIDISNSQSSEDNINKAKKISNELQVMLNIWTDDENIKTLSEKDKLDIFNTSILIIKKAKDLL